MKPTVYHNSFLASFLALMLLFVINSYGSDKNDKNSGNLLEPGSLNYLLPIGFQMAPVAKQDSNNCAEKDSSTSKTAKNKGTSKKRIYKVDINADFSHSTIRKTEEAFKQAEFYEADYILIHMDADNPDAENATSLIQSKLGNKSKPVFFYVDSKTNPNRSLLAITQGDSVNGKAESKTYNIRQYHFNSQKIHPKNKAVKNFTLTAINDRYNQSLNPAGYNAVTGNLITDILQNNNLSNFDVVQYNPGKYGKLIDLLTQRWVCLLFVAVLTWLIALQLKTREAGPYSFFILSLLAVMLGTLYEERLANFNEIILFLTGILLLFLNLFIRKRKTWYILISIGAIFSTCGLALILTSYNMDISLFIPQLSINILLICSIIFATLKVYAFLKTIHLQRFTYFKKVAYSSPSTNC